MTEKDVRERVIETAERLYYTRGIQTVGMDELRLAAGVSLKALYALFPSKAQIVLEVMDYRHRIWVDGVNAIAALAPTPRDKLLAIYDFLTGWFADDSFRGCGFVNAFAELGSVSPEVAQRAKDHKASFQAYVAGLVAEAGAPATLAPQLSILAEGAQVTAAISGTAEAGPQARAAAEVLIDASMTTRA